MPRALCLAFALALTFVAAPPALAARLPNGVMVSNTGELEGHCVTAVVVAEVKNRTFTSEEQQAAQYCAGYFSALNDLLMALRDDAINPFGICYPAQPLPPVVPIKAFLDFVTRHQDTRGAIAMPVALAALAETFPCNRVKAK